jgi:predicted transcriptional regulator
LAESENVPKIRAHIKTGFGEIEVEGDSSEELLTALKTVTSDFVGQVTNVVSSGIAVPVKAGLEGVVELTTEGPVVTTRERLSHYEAIGLILFASDRKASSATKISDLLRSSGIKSMVPARLNEMTKRGLVFKPDPARPEFKLTMQGERWIEDEVLQRLRGEHG